MIGGRLIRGELRARDDLAEPEPGAFFAVNQERMLSYPT
jgi:hypothetical protein